jgi:hypothetical protein
VNEPLDVRPAEYDRIEPGCEMHKAVPLMLFGYFVVLVIAIALF